ncbi:prepilin-type N-terminal cleavage/methylation domain-containing protein [Paenibacillus oenotherae]|uniref:Prepilin-type N-terminal cleavage/methylation domain-containing protein n=1 Tax=Paenibacillus oenotherae TaxID=1435645 RepID=A0ABS7D1U1_9BACL|nr:prepilin-type N-terminal cleavage/methylation domain-containing protein [Paenibacillus oenotherae]MBW7473836.1 prepilin-type N-terminal cleavage/methylation domain-containing protein [Paenibacillus oenotherae]
MPIHMNNDRGLTLIEVLGSIAITVIVLSTAIALFMGITDLSYSRGDGRNAQKDATYALSQISARLQDSNSVYKPNNNNELRFSTFANGLKSYKAIYYSAATQELWLYDFNAGSSTESFCNTTAGADISFLSNSGFYINGFKLADNVVVAPSYTYTASGVTQPIIGSYGSNQRINITITSQPSTKTTTSGGKHTPGSFQVRTSVKLYKY